MDKLAEEILNLSGILDKLQQNNYDLFHIKSSILEVMQQYHEAKLKEELIKFAGWFDTFRDIPSNELMTHEQLTNKYLKQRKDDTNS